MKPDLNDFLDDLKKSGLNITDKTKINVRIVGAPAKNKICVACQIELGTEPDLTELLLASMEDRPAFDEVCCLCDESIFEVGRAVAADFLKNVPLSS